MSPWGLLGEHLGHSGSPEIHAMLGDYPYALYEQPPEALEAFLQNPDLQGLNVTIPYKKTVMPYCQTLSERAARIGSVNTLVRQPDGSWFGDNTDYEGFAYALGRLGLPLAGKKVLVLGSGGASLAVRRCLEDEGARVVVISRTGKDNYLNIDRHADAELVVNATPVGMYPYVGKSALDLRALPACKGAIDLIYHPLRTAFLQQAEQLHMATENGLAMLVAQARGSAQQFLGREIPAQRVEEILQTLLQRRLNVVLIGMPGSGKSAVGRTVARLLGRPYLDADCEIANRAGMSIEEIFAAEGEAGFRKREDEVLRDMGRELGGVIATGGGCVTRSENYAMLHQNGVIVYLRRDLSQLSTGGRPLSLSKGVEALYAERKALYESFADLAVDNATTIEDAAARIVQALHLGKERV